MTLTHYLNGKFVTEQELLISPRDLGFTRGYAVFDFFRTYNGHKPFMFDSHIDRLFNSAKSIGLVLPWTKKDVKYIIRNTLELNDASKEFAVRIMISGGVSKTLLPPDAPTLLVIVDEAINFPESLYEKGVKALTIAHKRYMPGSKTSHYLKAVQNIHLMNTNGFGEILYVHKGIVLEGAVSNFFCIIDNRLITPKTGVLPGITRQVILEKLKINLPIEQRNININELGLMTEAFISMSGKGIVPVIQIDNTIIGDGKTGPNTKEIIIKFNNFVASGNW